MKPKFSEIFFYQRSLSRSRKGRSLFLFANSDIYLQLCIWNDYLIFLIASNYQILLDGPYHLRELALDWLLITQVVDLNAHHSDITKEPIKCASHLQTFCPRYFVSCISRFFIFLKTDWVRSLEIWSKTNSLCQTQQDETYGLPLVKSYFDA